MIRFRFRDHDYDGTTVMYELSLLRAQAHIRPSVHAPLDFGCPLLHCPEAETNCKVFYRSSLRYALAKSCESIDVWKIKSSGK